MAVLLIEVHLLEPFWHGAVDWPPSPFRLFQALVAGAYGGRWASEDEEAKRRRQEAFRWLENLNPPNIAFPPRSRARAVTSFVPNNDLDSVGGDPNRVADIRAEKTLVPWRIENDRSFVYAWTFDNGAEYADLLCSLANRLHRFGRGLDGAWAVAGVSIADDTDATLRGRGAISRPGGQAESGLRCPASGSLDSLIRRHDAAAARFQWDAANRKYLFRQPPKPVYRTVSYDFEGTRLYFEIRQSTDLNRFHPVSQSSVVPLTEELRDRAGQRLTDAMPDSLPLVERFLTGRTAGPADVNRRVRVIPLPSIGHSQTSPSIRRVVILIPPDCPLPLADVEWAFAGMPVSGSNTTGSGEAVAMLVQTTSPEMIQHYGFERPAKRWRSVTPVALPRAMQRVRQGSQRAESEAQAASAIAQACRHAGIESRPTDIRIQAEPFLLRGEPAQAYSVERFEGRLRHVEIAFDQSVRGPLLIGDGRFLGLGLMQPVFEKSPGLHVFAVKGPPSLTLLNAATVLRGLRRALMARAQQVKGANRTLPVFFHGHDPNGDPARNGNHAHLFFTAWPSGDSGLDRLAVIAPDFCDRTSDTTGDWRTLARSVEDLQFLVCGSAGEFHLRQISPENESVFKCSRTWRSMTAYRTTRHPKNGAQVAEFISSDLKAECRRRSLPVPETVEVLEIQQGPRGSLSADLKLTFRAAVRGPLLLGRGSHFGEGLFAPI